MKPAKVNVRTIKHSKTIIVGNLVHVFVWESITGDSVIRCD